MGVYITSLMAQSNPEFNLSVLIAEFAAVDPSAPQVLILDRIARFAQITGNVEMAVAVLDLINDKNPRLAQALIDSQQGHSASGVLIN